MRLFLAIALPDQIKKEAGRAALEQRSHINPRDKIQWVAADTLHLTLKFLGSCDPGIQDPLSKALAQVAEKTNSFPLHLGSFGCFPPKGSPHILWLGVEDPVKATQPLVETIETVCESFGFPKEARPYHPHLTIARVKSCIHPQGLRRLWSEESIPPKGVFQVDSFQLMESQLLPSGARYTTLKEFVFADKGQPALSR